MWRVPVAAGAVLAVALGAAARDYSISPKLIGADAPPAVRKQAKALCEPSGPGRIRAARALAKMGPAAAGAAKVLVEVLADDRLVPVSQAVRIRPAEEALKALRAIGPAAVAPLVAGLSHSVQLARYRSAEALAALGDAGAKKLAEAMGGKLPRRWNVQLALGRAGGAAAPLLTAMLKHESKKIRLFAVETLGLTRSAEAVDALIGVLACDDNDINWMAVRALKRTGAHAVGPLREALAHADPEVRERAVLTCREMGPQAAGAVAELAKGMSDRATGVRWGSAFALAKIGPAGEAALLKATQCDSNETRFVAVAGLCELPKLGVPASAALIAAMTDRDGSIRRRAIEGLTKHKVAAAADGMLAALNDEDVDVRRVAARGVGGAKDRRAIDRLIELLVPPDASTVKTSDRKRRAARLRASAADALQYITGERLGDDVEKWRAWRRANATTQPTTRPATRPTTQPTTRPADR